MQLRLFRIILPFTLLICFVIGSGLYAVGAKTVSRNVGRSFQPSGHGVLVPTKVNTQTMSQISAAEFNSTRSQQPASSSQAAAPATAKPLPPPPSVVNVPPPTGTDATVKKGLTKQAGKPDVNGTGGLDNYLETTNSAIGIYTRTGTLQKATTYRSWFNVTNAFYQPDVQWDDIGARFLFSVLQEGAQVVWLSVAQQSDATGTYCNYSIPVTNNRDFDRMGIDSDGIYFTVNVTGRNGLVVNNELVFASRTALESCQTATYTTWTGLTNPDGTIAQSITPARQDSSVSGVEYLVNSYPGGACQLTLWTLTSTDTLTNASVPTQCYTPPTNAKQEGSSALINTDDCRIDQASLVNGVLTVTTPGDYDWGDGNGPVGIVEWYQINVSTASISNQGAFGSPGYWYFYPAAITTANGHMEFVYSASGASIYPSVWYVNQTFTGATALANGTGPYGYSGLSPWGDYQSAWPDASGSTTNTVWITGEYVKSTNVYGTAFDLVTP